MLSYWEVKHQKVPIEEQARILGASILLVQVKRTLYSNLPFERKTTLKF